MRLLQLLAFWLLLFAGSAMADPLVSQYTYMPNPCVHPPTATNEYGFEPGCSGTSYAGWFSARMAINSLGMREREFATWPAKGVIRVLLLGASNALGQGLPENQTLASRLEVILRARLKRPVEVLNGAVPGYYTWQSAMRLHTLIDRVHPQLVLYHVQTPTCFVYDAAWENRIVFSPDGDPLRYDRSLLGEDTRFPWANTMYFGYPQVFLALHTVFDQLRRLSIEWGTKRSDRSDQARILEAATKRALEYMARRSRKSGAQFFGFFNDSHETPFNQFVPGPLSVGTVKLFSSLTPAVSISSSELEFELRSSSVPILHLPSFRYLAIPGDQHLSAEGNAEWAAALARVLLDTWKPAAGEGT